MINPFSARTRQRPILAPLARKRSLPDKIRARAGRFPPAAAPIAVTLIGGLAILALFASLMGKPEFEPETAGPATIEEAIADSGKDTVAPPNKMEVIDAAVGAATKASELKPAPAAVETVADDSLFEPAKTADDGDLGVAAALSQQEDDADASTVAVAETPDEILALEAAQRREVEADIGTPSNEKTAGIPPVSPPKVAAIAKKWVNMRAGPSDDAQVLMVVPALAELKAESACNWCAVTYDGHQGYIYKNFISYE